MIALGVAYRADAPAALAVPDTPLALVCATLADAGDVRARMAGQLDWAGRLSAFLPFSPAGAIPPATARDWCSDHLAQVEDRLAALRDAGQVSITARSLTPDPDPGPTPDGTGWLRARAARTRARQDAVATLRRQMEDRFAPLSPRDLVVEETARGLSFHLLLDRHEIADRLARFRTGLTASPPATGTPWQMTVTGPWPAYNFCTGAPAR